MAMICRRSESNLVCISGNIVAVYQDGCDDRVEYAVERACFPSCAADNTDQDVSGSDLILAAAFSRFGRYFACVDDWRQLAVWATAPDRAAWRRLSTRLLTRRANSLTFTNDEKWLLVADKTGEVYRFCVEGAAEKTAEGVCEGQLLLGHLSMLLDIVTSRDDKYVITCDRDEKIRVSRLPNAYNIETFCLGHTEFVSRVILMEEDDVLLSSSGDGTLRVWAWREGRQLASLDYTSALSDMTTTPDSPAISSQDEREKPSIRCMEACQKSRRIVLSFDGLPVVLVCRLEVRCAGGPDMCASLSFAQPPIHCHAPPASLALDSRANLFVLMEDVECVMCVFTSSGADVQEPYQKSLDPALKVTVDAILSHGHHFKASMLDGKTSDEFRKRHFDGNVKMYLERKRARIEQKGVKRGQVGATLSATESSQYGDAGAELPPSSKREASASAETEL